jgi:hypothetical protein
MAWYRLGGERDAGPVGKLCGHPDRTAAGVRQLTGEFAAPAGVEDGEP